MHKRGDSGQRPDGPTRWVVKIFFQKPDYYVHGTDDVESLGSVALTIGE